MTLCLTPEQCEQLVVAGPQGDREHTWIAHVESCRACAELLERCRADAALVARLKPIFLGLSMEDETVDLDVSKCPDGKGGGLPPTDTLPGYRIIREIHRGGQGVVYEAIQESTNRTVAVKVMLDGALAGERARWRFEQEVKLVAQLNHPHIVAVHDSGIHQGRYFYAMDYVRGQPLDTHVRLAKPGIREIVKTFTDVCDAITYAHQRRIIHRDLKPSNILVSEDGGPQVLDFGLAKLTGLPKDKDSVTVTGQIMGTIRYMSPEQTLGAPDSVDTRSDIYSLGVILYELLTGTSPYPTHVELVEALNNIREVSPVRPSRVRREVNSEMDAILLRALAKEPDRRYQSVSEFKGDLSAWLEGRPVSAKSDSSFYVLRKLAVRHSFQTSMIMALLASVIGFGGITYHSLLQTRQTKLELQRVNEEVVQENLDLDRQLRRSEDFLGEQTFGWFLAEWRDRRLDTARQFYQALPPESPSHKAGRFLLEVDRTLADLLAEMPADQHCLAFFVAAEREFAGGDAARAADCLRRAVQGGRGRWKLLAEARLAQMGAAERPFIGGLGQEEPIR